MDPFYRTLFGFQVLIEKEWLAFGHMFNTRYGQGHNDNEGSRSPIFIQFLDCVYQLLQQFPSAFEFNEMLLIELADALYSCRFGTFLCNSESERQGRNLAALTPSVWSYISHHARYFVNPLYQARASPLRALTTYDNFVLWRSYYLRFHRLAHPESRLTPAQELSRKLHTLQREIDTLQTQLKQAKALPTPDPATSLAAPAPPVPVAAPEPLAPTSPSESALPNAAAPATPASAFSSPS